jgi:hypothetical protein
MSQAGIIDIENSHPQIPTSFVTNSGTAIPIGNVLEILGTTVAAHGVPLQTIASGNTVTVQDQYASANATSDPTKAGVASFNSTYFTVDANGFVSLVSSGLGVLSVSGTPNRITSTGGQNPVIDIAATYVGQTSITTLGTITTGTWNGTTIGPTFGGTGQSTYTTGDTLYASAANVLSKLPIGSTNQVLTVISGIPSWQTPSSGTVTSVSGTLNRITSTGGSTPVIDIASTYVGQTSITTLGTITTGTWNGTTIGPTFGGTGQSTYATGDMLYASGVNTLAKLAATTNGFILTLAGGVPTWAAAGSSSITIAGDTGTATGNSFTFNGLSQAGSTVSFKVSGTTISLNTTDADFNTMVGNGAGNASITATTSSGFGYDSLTALTSGNGNSAFGSTALRHATSSPGNTAMGSVSLNSLTTGSGLNTAIGAGSASSLLTGTQNVFVGWNAGTGYTGAESSNIIIGAQVTGTAGESNVLRIGNQGSGAGQQNEAFIAGIAGVTVANTTYVTQNSVTGQLGVVSSVPSSITITGNSGGALTGNSFTFTGGTTGLTFSGSGTTETLGGTLALANGGTNASLTASNGGIFYSTASAGAILAGTATAGQMLQSGASSAPSWSTTTYPATNAINTLLYASSANVMSALATANGGVLATSASGVPSIDTTNFSVLSTGVQVKGNNTNTAPPAGFIGQQIRATAAPGSTAISTTVVANIVTISLTAGVWDVSFIACAEGLTTSSAFVVAISTNSASLTGTVAGDSQISFPLSSTSTQDACFSIPSFRILQSSTANVYGVVKATFSASSSPNAYGRISATRVG